MSRRVPLFRRWFIGNSSVGLSLVATSRVSSALLAGALLTSAPTKAVAVVLDGTSGSNSISTTYSTTGNLTLELGFFAEYLAVGGGGGGGGGSNAGLGGGGGGGGAAAVVTNIAEVNPTSYPVAVGAGGSGGNGGDTSFWNGGIGANGGASSVFGATAAGGFAGWGAAVNTYSPNLTWSDGTGGIGGQSGSAQAGGGKSTNASGGAGGGGGGSAGAGSGAGTGTGAGAAGGAGTISAITGVSRTYGVGGTGGAGSASNVAGSPGGSNTGTGGNGGGGASFGQAAVGGNGGSGLVVVRYQGSQAATGGTISSGTGTATGYTLHQFTTTGSSALDFSGLNLSTRLGATLTSNLTGSGNLTYSGPGRLALTGTGSYSGTTTVSAGTLLINGNNSAAAGAVAVLNGATLGGTGIVGGSTTIQSGGVHSPGASPGLQTFGQNLTYQAGAGVTWELIANDATPADAGIDYDQISVLGNLDFAGATSLGLSFNSSGSSVAWGDAFWSANRSWLVWDTAGTTSNFGNLAVSPLDWLDSNSVSLSSARPLASFAVTKVGQDVQLIYTVPEPAGMASAAAAAVAVGLAVRGRRR